MDGKFSDGGDLEFDSVAEWNSGDDLGEDALDRIGRPQVDRRRGDFGREVVERQEHVPILL